MRQSSLAGACNDIAMNVDGAVACAVVDADTGLPLAYGVADGAGVGGTGMELLAAAAVTFFKSSASSLALAEQEAGTSAADDANDVVQDIQVTTLGAHWFMSRIASDRPELLVLVVDRNVTNLGFGWMSMRRSQSAVRELYEQYERGEPPPPPEDPVEPEGDAGPREPLGPGTAFAGSTGLRRSIRGAVK